MLIFLMSCLALAGDTDVDAVARFDREGPTGTPIRTVGAAWEVQLSPAEWLTARPAAATSLTAFDAWMAGSAKPAEVKAMYAGLPVAWREQVRLAVLGLAP